MRHAILELRRSQSWAPAWRGHSWAPASGRWLMLFLSLGGCAPDQTETPAAEEAALVEGSVAGEDVAESVGYSVFNEVPDAELAGRLTLHVLVLEPADRARLSKTLRELLPERAAADPALVAIRAIAFYPIVQSGEVEGDLAPIAWAEWIPIEGWFGDVGDGRGTNHRVYFYHGSPPPW